MPSGVEALEQNSTSTSTPLGVTAAFGKEK